MKHLKSIAIFVVVIISLSSCQKDDTENTFYFYTSTDITNNALNLYIDGDLKGVLSNAPTTTDCSSAENVLSSLIVEQLVYGKYKIEARDDNGDVKSSGTIKFGKNVVSTGGNGGLGFNRTDDCFVVDVFE